MKKLLFALCMLFTAATFVACEDDDETLFERLVGRVWIGDLGMYDQRIPVSYPLESAIYLGSDGFGSDDLCYYDNGEPFAVFNIQWDAYDGNLYINYGNRAAPRELRNVRVRRGWLTGDLFIDRRFYGEVSLRMQ